VTAPYDDGGGEPLAAPPSDHTPPGFGAPGQQPSYQGSPLAAPKPPRHKLFVGLMAFFGLLALVAVVGFFVTAGTEHSSSPVGDGAVVRPLPSGGIVISQAPRTPRATGGGRTLGPVPKPVTYRGTGSKTIRIRKPEAGAVILDITGRPAGNGFFAVYAIGDNGARIPVVSGFEPAYKGSWLLDAVFTTTTALEIDASGPWSVTLRSTRSATEMGRVASGSGDTVFLYTGPAGVATLRGGTANKVFRVQTLERGFPRLVLTHLGTYSGTKPWPAGPVLVEVHTTGRWSITVR